MGVWFFYDNGNGKNDASLLQCKFFEKKKQIPLKFMFYFPIIIRLQRMFVSMQTTQHMT